MKVVGDSVLKNKELRDLKVALEKANRLTGKNEINNRGKFFYAINKNLDKVEREIELIEKVLSPKKEFLEFDQKRIEKLQEFAKKDENGNPLIIKEENENGQVLQRYDLEDEKGWEEAFKLLQEENKDVIEERKKQADDYIQLMESDCSIEFFTITLDMIPEDCDGELQRRIKVIINNY